MSSRDCSNEPVLSRVSPTRVPGRVCSAVRYMLKRTNLKELRSRMTLSAAVFNVYQVLFQGLRSQWWPG